MNYIEVKKRDGSVKVIFVDHTVQAPEKLNYNQLAQYHREAAKKIRDNEQRNN